MGSLLRSSNLPPFYLKRLRLHLCIAFTFRPLHYKSCSQSIVLASQKVQTSLTLTTRGFLVALVLSCNCRLGSCHCIRPVIGLALSHVARPQLGLGKGSHSWFWSPPAFKSYSIFNSQSNKKFVFIFKSHQQCLVRLDPLVTFAASHLVSRTQCLSASVWLLFADALS